MDELQDLETDYMTWQEYWMKGDENLSWNTENEIYRCMVDTLVRMMIQEKTKDEMEQELAKRAEDLDIESQITFITNFHFIIARLQDGKNRESKTQV